MSDAIETLLVNHLPRLRSYALSLTRCGAAADDLAQETAVNILRAKSRFTLGTNFSAWSCRIMRNAFINNLRAARRITVYVAAVSEEHFAHHGNQEASVMASETMAAVATLPRNDRATLVALARHGGTYQDTADRLGVKFGTFKSRLARARTKLNLSLLEARPLPASLADFRSV